MSLLIFKRTLSVPNGKTLWNIFKDPGLLVFEFLRSGSLNVVCCYLLGTTPRHACITTKSNAVRLAAHALQLKKKTYPNMTKDTTPSCFCPGDAPTFSVPSGFGGLYSHTFRSEPDLVFSVPSGRHFTSFQTVPMLLSNETDVDLKPICIRIFIMAEFSGGERLIAILVIIKAKF